MTFRAPVVIGLPRPQPPSHRRCLMAAAVSSTLPLILRRAWRVSGARGEDAVASPRVPVAAAVAEEGEVLRVLARRHGGDALELVLHRRNLLKDLRLQERQAEGEQAHGCNSAQPRLPNEPRPQQPLAASWRCCSHARARRRRRTSLSGVISQFLSQSQAPLPSDTLLSPPAAAADTSTSCVLAMDNTDSRAIVPPPSTSCSFPVTNAGVITLYVQGGAPV